MIPSLITYFLLMISDSANSTEDSQREIAGIISIFPLNGLNTIHSPTNPIIVAIVLLIPIFSPRRKYARTKVNNGIDILKTVTVDIGIFFSDEQYSMNAARRIIERAR